MPEWLLTLECSCHGVNQKKHLFGSFTNLELSFARLGKHFRGFSLGQTIGSSWLKRLSFLDPVQIFSLMRRLRTPFSCPPFGGHTGSELDVTVSRVKKLQ